MNQFGFRNSQSNRLKSACKECVARYSREHHANNRANRLVVMASYRANHKGEIAEYGKKYSAEHKEDKALYELRRKYGIAPEQYTELIVNGCEVCGEKENLHVDHDHSCCPGGDTCGKCIRGALCRSHNLALGYMHDSVSELTAMIAYLMKFEGGRPNGNT